MSYLFLSCTEIEDINKVEPEYSNAPWFGPQFTAVELSSDQTQREKDVFNAVFAQLILLTKQAAHWRERQRAQTILWLSEGKTWSGIYNSYNKALENLEKSSPKR